MKLDALEHKVMEQMVNTPTQPEEAPPSTTNIVFPVHHFFEMPQLKVVLKDIETDIQALLGPTKVVVASKKGRSIGNRVLRNSAICRTPGEDKSDRVQKCNAPQCLTCKHMCSAEEEFIINDQKLKILS